jgi:hypothetical protein
MAVLVEANSVIVRVPAIHERYSGGWAAFDDGVPNNTLCCDGKLARVGFMDPRDSASFIAGLERRGLTYVQAGKSLDIAVAVQGGEMTAPCDWLESGQLEIKPGQIVAAVWLKGTTAGEVLCPAGWAYEKSLSRQYAVVPPGQVEKSLTFLRRQNGLDVYLNQLTGQEVYIGRPNVETE